MMTRNLLLGLLALVLVSFGQTSLKFGLNHIGGFSLVHGVSEFIKLIRTPWIAIGFGCYGLSATL
jgi:hypothetical protein